MNFLHEEFGGVTVDWTVLTAGLVGLGVASVAIVSSGVQNLSSDIFQQLDRNLIDASFSPPGPASSSEPSVPVIETQSTDFASGADGWSGATVSFIDNAGAVLGPISNTHGTEAVSKTFDLPNDTTKAEFKFDLMALDTWDASDQDGATIYYDGQLIATATATHHSDGRLDWVFEDIPGVEINTTATSLDQNIGHRHHPDSVYYVTITDTDPSSTAKIGFGANFDADINNESLGIDNFSITTTSG